MHPRHVLYHWVTLLSFYLPLPFCWRRAEQGLIRLPWLTLNLGSSCVSLLSIWGYSTVLSGPVPRSLMNFSWALNSPSRTINSADIWGLSSIGNLTEKRQDLCTPFSPNKPQSLSGSASLTSRGSWPCLDARKCCPTPLIQGWFHPSTPTLIQDRFIQRQNMLVLYSWQDSGFSPWSLVFHDCDSYVDP